ncbi:LysR family transcriptional regulator [Hoyosella sp. G463]|uniref:LysR family transcriptional regulator n=1 Tax=Lolliginicoccus lacisalsi TaxID=2742202 RepID=A0A927PMF3_9ACTN|nr:LysR family transcriptional regulator [Lolliginicoccus lacisalsi]MBD8506764.1 LysR family transcriptional regulator [Lolliginicoccus lacisalsi]
MAARTSDALHEFIAIAEHGQVSAAADELGIAQPTLSRRLRRLETDLGATLFDRRGHHLVITAAGRILLDHARRASAELDTARRRIADLANPALGTVRLGFLHSFGSWLVPRLIREFRATEPRVTFTLAQDAASTITDRVLDGTLDLGIVSPRPHDTGIAWTQLIEQQLALAVPDDHPLASRQAVDLAEAAAEPFITMHHGYGMRRILEEHCATAGFRPRITFETSELLTIAGMVAAGLGVALMPIEQHPLLPEGLVQIPLAGARATRDVGLVRSAAAPQPPAVQAFHDFVIARSGVA